MTFPGWILLLVLNQCLCYDLTYFVKEDQSPGIYVGDIASDTRLLENIPVSDRRLIKFSQLLQGVVGSPLLFRVARKTGKLYTAQSLDAESLCRHNKECAQFVKVAVRREESFIKILKVRVIIKDINDHVPEFPVNQINIEFSENDAKGTKVSIPNAVDGDIGAANSQITYGLEKSDYNQFMLALSKNVEGNIGLSIELKEKLDREVQDSYIIRVTATDGGSPSKKSVLLVNVSIIDINDNTPVFSQSVYNVSVIYRQAGDIPGLVLSARDLDSGENGRIFYHFTSKTSDLVKSYFVLKELTGEIYLRRNFEAKQNWTYELFVKATDGGSPPLSSIATVFVEVINQENTAPIININFFSASTKNSTTISEDIRVGNFIAYVLATDRDAGQNGEVSCDLKHDKFRLQSLAAKEYKITISNPIDRETTDHYEIGIHCQDKGTPPLRSEASFSVQVTDVNDMKPQFSNETFIFYINENEKSSAWVGSINAIDLDLGPGGKVTYSLLANNERFLPFQISDDGNITSVMSLDSEFQDIYKFWVVAKDHGTPSLNNSVHVSVKVQDLNDNAPYFTFPSVNPFTLDIVYHPNQTRNITMLKASDSDSLDNALLKYELRNGNSKQLFVINELTGLLSFSREMTQTDSGVYNLQFGVKDSGVPILSATTSLTLRLVVSNRTFEKLNVVHIDPNDKIHMYLLIFIVLVAISASVIITAPISVCIIRCNDRKNPKRKRVPKSSNKRVSDLRMSVCPTYWSEELDNVNDEDDDLENTLAKTKRASCGKNEANKELRNRYLEMKARTDKDIIYEVSRYSRCKSSKKKKKKKKR